MSQVIEFLTPRMVGERFAEHAIPLELLKDLAVLEEMIIEVAKWCYLQDHPDRKRSPKGFTDGVALKLSGIGEGSAVPQLSLVVEQTQLFPPQAQTYFEQARTHLIRAIDAAEHDEPITPHLPDALLAYFDRFGRSLRDGETIEFAPQAADRKARLTKATRRKLVLASSQVQELTEEVTLRGSIPEADQGKMTFELQVINGPRVVAPVAGQYLSTVMEAFNGYKQGAHVLLQGIGRYNRYDRLQSLETVEHLSLLEVNDIAARLEELKTLRHGWLDGKKGFAPDKAGLDWLAVSFQRYYPDELTLPYLYPTAEGGVQAEWSLNGWEISLEVDLGRHQGQWHALDMTNELEQEKTLNLNDPVDWQWLATEITGRTGGDA
ncbi:hypothetical protein [Aeromonas dhakensis]|uniref:hypothetical protein n=3 Tax=Aeromonas TaxID=642 RepID=UPI000F51E048|nr:hypothetical protein [Aeromonas dhakensis]RQM93016.1 hypothetical protein EHZ77_05150 [Aeromonas dhakensis]